MKLPTRCKLFHGRRIDLTKGRFLSLTHTLEPIVIHFVHYVSVKLVGPVKPRRFNAAKTVMVTQMILGRGFNTRSY